MKKNKLILIAGLSASGKTSLANYFEDFLPNSIRINIDDYAVNLYKTIGFLNKNEKKRLKYSAKIMALENMKYMINKGHDVIMEYCWSFKDEELLYEYLKKIQITPIIITVRVDCSYKTAYKRYLERKSNFEYAKNFYSNCYPVKTEADIDRNWTFEEYKEKTPEGCDSFFFGKHLISIDMENTETLKKRHQKYDDALLKVIKI